MPREAKQVTIDAELRPKSAISYALAQAILALGKDDLTRVSDNITHALYLIAHYREQRTERKDKRDNIGNK